MKKALLVFAMGALLSLNVKAQSTFTLNTRAWSTNYFTTVLYDIANNAVEYLLFSDSTNRLTYSRIIPSSDLVFPIGIEKKGFEDNDIFGPYHRAFKNPFTRPGDFGVGLDASWSPTFFGLYAGAYFKSQEICFRANDDNLRSFYFQPRAGIIIGGKNAIEAGVYYDMVVGAGGRFPGVEKDMFSSGLGLDFALSHKSSNKHQTIIAFMLPLHNFLNENYAKGDLNFNGIKRRVGYIMLTERIEF